MSEAYIRKGPIGARDIALEIVLFGELSHDEEFTTMHECSSKCRKLTTMFAYGTNDFGRKGCNDDGKKNGLCKCHCIYDKEDRCKSQAKYLCQFTLNDEVCTKNVRDPTGTDRNANFNCVEIDPQEYWIFKFKDNGKFEITCQYLLT